MSKTIVYLPNLTINEWYKPSEYGGLWLFYSHCGEIHHPRPFSPVSHPCSGNRCGKAQGCSWKGTFTTVQHQDLASDASANQNDGNSWRMAPPPVTFLNMLFLMQETYPCLFNLLWSTPYSHHFIKIHQAKIYPDYIHNYQFQPLSVTWCNMSQSQALVCHRPHPWRSARGFPRVTRSGWTNASDPRRGTQRTGLRNGMAKWGGISSTYITSHYIYIYLIGGIPIPVKNLSQLGRIIPYIMENKKCSKPPTIYKYIYI